MKEFCLNITPFMQPKPTRNKGGDCFACSVTAGLRHLFPERPVEFETAWNYFMAETMGGSKQLNNTWTGMRRALYEADSDGYGMTILSDIVRPTYDTERFSHNWWGFVPDYEYTRRLEGWLRGGWVAFAEINHEGAGPVTPEGKLNHPNHFVLVDGAREVWEPSLAVSGARTLLHYVHVVCSAKGAYWIPAYDWLVKHGAAAWWLARRDELPSRKG